MSQKEILNNMTHLGDFSQEVIQGILEHFNDMAALYDSEHTLDEQAISLLQKIIIKSKEDSAYQEKIENWLSDESDYSTVYFRDEIVSVFGDPSPNAPPLSENNNETLFNLWVSLDSAVYNTRLAMQDTAMSP